MTEQSLHLACVEYMNYALASGVVFHHSPAEGRHQVQYLVKQKRMGVKTGWPDIEIFHRGRAYFIELKMPKKYPTQAQRNLHRDLMVAGCPVSVCRSLDELIGTLRGWGLIAEREAA